MPAAARAAIEKVAADGTIKSIEKIEWNGKVTYEVEYRKDGKDLDAFHGRWRAGKGCTEIARRMGREHFGT